MPSHHRKRRKTALLTGSPSVGGSSVDIGSSVDMQLRTLGRSGDKVSIVDMGGSRIGKQNDEQESICITRNHFDATARHPEWLG